MSIFSIVFVLGGAVLILIAAIGILRMPDLLMRMHTATKAGTLGTGLILVGVMCHFRQASVVIESLLAIFVVFITAPIASHLLARSSYFHGVKLAKLTIMDELRDFLERKKSKGVKK